MAEALRVVNRLKLRGYEDASFDGRNIVASSPHGLGRISVAWDAVPYAPMAGGDEAATDFVARRLRRRNASVHQRRLRRRAAR